MCGLARFVTSLTISAAQTASTQWLERTLDDSVNRRLTLPQAFLTVDAVLRLALNITNGLVVHPEVIARHVAAELPKMVTEPLLMAAVAKGGDRQALHERIRQHSIAAAEQVKAGGRNDLLDRLRADPAFARVNVQEVVDEAYLVGRAPEQVSEWIATEIEPIRSRYRNLLGQKAEINV
jgi:adenylosuccinate lyase